MSDTRKYPAHSTAPYQSPKRSRKIPHALYVIAAVCIFVAVMGTFYMVVTRVVWREPVKVAANSVHVVPELHTETEIRNTLISTLTPTPTATYLPTRTPYPTFTQVIPTVRAGSEIIYIEKFTTVEVTRIIERVITQTPNPITPTPTVDVTHGAAVLQLGIEKRNNIGIWVLGLILAPPLFVASLLVSYAIISAWFEQNVKPKMEGKTETAEEIAEVPINDARRDRLIITYHRAGWSNRKIEDKIFGYTGGDAYDTVKRVIEEYEEQQRTTPPPSADFDGAGVA